MSNSQNQSQEARIVAVLKKYPGITARMDLSLTSPLVIELASVAVPQPANTLPIDNVIAQKMQLSETMTVFFEGDWKWVGKLTEEQMAKVCAYADRVQDER